ILADRKIVEQEAEKTILKDAETKNVSFLVIGDALSATTHIDLVKRAKEKNIEVKIVHNASVLTAVGETGLQLYKFGKTTSMPFPEENFKPETAYDVIKENKKNNLHTLVLLDLRPQENKFMTANEAIKILLDIQEKRKENILEKIVVCARIGSEDEQVVYGNIKELKEEDFGKPVHCLIIPSKLHFAEEEFLKVYENA
ncbi:diphthine synthase, partial [Candidatus Woesearchaeota archaeon]|nr:diphthine synthase [Candidatus Woesearchaeota archaeon]